MVNKLINDKELCLKMGENNYNYIFENLGEQKMLFFFKNKQMKKLNITINNFFIFLKAQSPIGVGKEPKTEDGTELKSIVIF